MDIFYDLPDLNRIFPVIRLSVSARFVFISASTVSSNVLLKFSLFYFHIWILSIIFSFNFLSFFASDYKLLYSDNG